MEIACSKGAAQQRGGGQIAGAAEHEFGVVGGDNTALENQVVTGELLFTAKLSGDGPRERVKPEERAGKLGNVVPEAIMPRDMRGFVQQDRAAVERGPAVGFARQEDAGPQDTTA
jgi:hypothetical protein